MSWHPSTTLPPGVPNSDPSDYHKLGTEFPRGDARRTMSRGETREFGVCPRRWLLGAPKAESEALEWGNLIDNITFGNQLVYAVTPPTYAITKMQCPRCGSMTDYSARCSVCKCERARVTIDKPWNWNADYCEKWKAEHIEEGKIPVKSELYAEAWKAHERLLSDEHIRAILAASETQVQVNVEWQDEATGIVVPFKCLLDVVPTPDSEFGDTLADLKTTRNAGYEAWRRQVFSDGLHYQAAVYIDAMNAASELRYRKFEHLIQESEPPYEPTHRMLSAEFVAIGRESYKRDLVRYCWSLKNKQFAGYDCALVEPSPYMIL